MLKENVNRSEKREARRKHKKVLQPILNKATKLVGTENEHEEFIKLNQRWVDYCIKYDKENNREFPNHDAFKMSVSDHWKP